MKSYPYPAGFNIVHQRTHENSELGNCGQGNESTILPYFNQLFIGDLRSDARGFHRNLCKARVFNLFKSTNIDNFSGALGDDETRWEEAFHSEYKHKTRAYAWRVYVSCTCSFFGQIYENLSCLDKITDLTLISNWIAENRGAKEACCVF